MKQFILLGWDSNLAKTLGAAQNAGVGSILFFPPEHGKVYKLEDLKQLKPTHVVMDFRQILQIV